MSWLFSCFKHDPSKDNLKTALKISRHQDEDTAARLKLDEELIEKAKKESLEEVEEEEAKSKLEKSKEKGKRKQVVDDDQVEHKGQTKHSKDHVEEIVNTSICKGCNSKIEDERFVNAFGDLWHLQCLCCLHCHKPFAADEIPTLKRQFHKPCYKEHCNPNCYVCENKIPSTEEGRKFSEHPFWKEKYCPSHDGEGIAKCCSCERLEACGTKYVMLDDDRWLCRECLECAIMDTYECHDLHVEIREFFQSLNMNVEKEFPVFLVEKEALNKAEKEEKIDNQYGVVTRGICLSEEQMITSVSKRPDEVNNRLVGMTKESQRVIRECEVTAILILYGLPKFLTGYILAHEMMHAYLRLNGYRNLNIVLEEGLCQVLGHMWLEPHTYATPDVVAIATPISDSSSGSSSSRAPPLGATTSKKGDKSDFEKKFVKFCKYQIQEDDSPIYGVGFRKVNSMMVANNHNLKDTLKQIVSASKSIPAPKF